MSNAVGAPNTMATIEMNEPEAKGGIMGKRGAQALTVIEG